MLVSILIPCWNSERWIADAIKSALVQTWSQKEIIVIDDGSTDESLNIIKRFGNWIRWETGPNRGGNVTRNRLLEIASGEWVQYLDADDYLLPNKVRNQASFLVTYPETDVVFGPVVLEHCGNGQTRQEMLAIPEPHDVWILLARWYLPQTGAPLWRRNALVEVGGWRPDQPCCQEHELYLRLLMQEKRFRYCPHGGAVYRQWSQTTVCKKNIPEVHRQRLAIEQRMEEFLGGRGLLTHERRHAINEARLEMARSIWQYDPNFASEIVSTVLASEPNFRPSVSAATPYHYRMALRILGFRAAERLADLSRLILGRKAV